MSSYHFFFFPYPHEVKTLSLGHYSSEENAANFAACVLLVGTIFSIAAKSNIALTFALAPILALLRSYQSYNMTPAKGNRRRGPALARASFNNTW